jgi:hypothetical protein
MRLVPYSDSDDSDSDARAALSPTRLKREEREVCHSLYFPHCGHVRTLAIKEEDGEGGEEGVVAKEEDEEAGVFVKKEPAEGEEDGVLVKEDPTEDREEGLKSKEENGDDGDAEAQEGDEDGDAEVKVEVKEEGENDVAPGHNALQEATGMDAEGLELVNRGRRIVRTLREYRKGVEKRYKRRNG